MRRLFIVCVMSAMAGSAAFADPVTPTCTGQASEKKLAGAALTSFMKKCTDDAASACTKQSADKKLAGAAKTSFEKKCKEDAVGAPPASK